MSKILQEDIDRFWSYVDKKGEDECWGWKIYIDDNGYGRFKCNNITYRAHQFSYIITNGNPINYVCHTCDNKPCSNPKHLYDGTAQQNLNDAIERGQASLCFPGEVNGRAKLKEKDVIEIRELYDDRKFNRLTIQKIANKYGVANQLVSRIGLRQCWTHL